ncbi:MAG: AtpZ/AtpI family protein [Hyphomonadaceae bacterium]
MGDDLNKRIADAQARLDAKSRPPKASTGKGVGQGIRMASDFVAAVIVGLALGWGVDFLFHTSPWGLIVCLLLGFITGVRNVVAQAIAAQKQAGQTDTAAGNGAGETDEGDGA